MKKAKLEIPVALIYLGGLLISTLMLLVFQNNGKLFGIINATLIGAVALLLLTVIGIILGRLINGTKEKTKGVI